MSVEAWSGSTKYEFETDPLGGNPSGTTLQVIEPSSSGFIEIANQAGRKCARIAKRGGSERVRIVDNFTVSEETAGVIHCKIYHDDSAFGLNLDAKNGNYLIDMVWWNGHITSKPNGAFLAHYARNAWLDLEIYFNYTRSGWMFTLNGVLYGVGYSIPFSNGWTANATKMIWSSFFSAGGDGDLFVDDIGYDFSGVVPIPNVGSSYPFTDLGDFPLTTDTLIFVAIAVCSIIVVLLAIGISRKSKAIHVPQIHPSPPPPVIEMPYPQTKQESVIPPPSTVKSPSLSVNSLQNSQEIQGSSTKYCPYCGHVLGVSIQLCPNCGSFANQFS